MPRKTVCFLAHIRDEHDASMRPRPDATENVRELVGARHPLCASMRPRPDATENGLYEAAQAGVNLLQ